jgi:hypothetical protein
LPGNGFQLRSFRLYALTGRRLSHNLLNSGTVLLTLGTDHTDNTSPNICSIVVSRSSSTDHVENTASPRSPLGLFLSNGRCLQSHCVATCLHVTILWHICSRQELWSRRNSRFCAMTAREANVPDPFRGNSSVNTFPLLSGSFVINHNRRSLLCSGAVNTQSTMEELCFLCSPCLNVITKTNQLSTVQLSFETVVNRQLRECGSSIVRNRCQGTAGEDTASWSCDAVIACSSESCLTNPNPVSSHS